MYIPIIRLLEIESLMRETITSIDFAPLLFSLLVLSCLAFMYEYIPHIVARLCSSSAKWSIISRLITACTTFLNYFQFLIKKGPIFGENFKKTKTNQLSYISLCFYDIICLTSF